MFFADFKMLVVLSAVCMSLMLTNTFFVKAEKPHDVLEMKQVSTSMAVSSNVGLLCPDPNWYCNGLQPCCKSSSGWRCCNYIGGNCCPDGMSCCPLGYVCVWYRQCRRIQRSSVFSTPKRN